jgi:hypothetical protein
MKKSVYLIFFVASLPTIALAARQPATLSKFSDTIVELADDVAGILFALAFIGFLWGLLKVVTHGGSGEKKQDGMRTMTNGLIGLFVIAGLWGILYAVKRTLFGL